MSPFFSNLFWINSGLSYLFASRLEIFSTIIYFICVLMSCVISWSRFSLIMFVFIFMILSNLKWLCMTIFSASIINFPYPFLLKFTENLQTIFSTVQLGHLIFIILISSWISMGIFWLKNRIICSYCPWLTLYKVPTESLLVYNFSVFILSLIWGNV